MQLTPAETVDECILAVNGTLMRDLPLHTNLASVGARYLGPATTAASYRLWSIRDVHPAMQRVLTGGVAIALELYALSHASIATVLLKEPTGLCIGTVELADGNFVLGVLGENWLCTGGTDISDYGGWRAYISSRSNAH